MHQPDKPDIGKRLSLQIHKFLVPGTAPKVVAGPRAVRATAKKVAASTRSQFTVSVTVAGGNPPFTLKPTRNCTTCCTGALTVDLDASADGKFWANASGVTLSGASRASPVLTFDVDLPAVPTMIAHTRASIWPQCALYNAEGLPLFPFDIAVSTDKTFAEELVTSRSQQLSI